MQSIKQFRIIRGRNQKWFSGLAARAVEEGISTAWDMERESEVLRRSKMSRLEISQKFVEDPCTEEGCNGRWLQCAEQILLWNDVSREAFSETVTNLLEKGKGKFRIILLKRAANTGKRFFLIH